MLAGVYDYNAVDGGMAKEIACCKLIVERCTFFIPFLPYMHAFYYWLIFVDYMRAKLIFQCKPYLFLIICYSIQINISTHYRFQIKFNS